MAVLNVISSCVICQATQIFETPTAAFLKLLLWNTAMVSFDGGSASKVDDVTA